MLGEKLLSEGKRFAQSFNFGPDTASAIPVGQVAQKVAALFGKDAAAVELYTPAEDLPEAGLLFLDNRKALELLDWKPKYSIDESLQKTVAWYQQFYQGEEMEKFSAQQIEAFSIL
jgi:CDP-glucose 4,6-dehydratase